MFYHCGNPPLSVDCRQKKAHGIDLTSNIEVAGIAAVVLSVLLSPW